MQSEAILLDQLIRRLQKEGVDQAQQEAARIIEEAQKEAQEIKRQAIGETKEWAAEAKAELHRHQEALEQRLRLAARDLVLLTKENLEQAFAQFLKQSIQKNFTQEVMQKALLALAKSFNQGDKLTLVWPEAMKEQLANQLTQAFAQALGQEVEQARDQGLEQGFWLYLDEEKKYYDFSVRHLGEIFFNRLSGPIKEALVGFNLPSES